MVSNLGRLREVLRDNSEGTEIKTRNLYLLIAKGSSYCLFSVRK